MGNTENNYQETDLGNVSPNPRGEYDPSAEYEYLDLVSYQGGSYLCLAELGTKITGTAPEAGKNTDYWQLVTLPGDLTPEYVAMHDDVANKSKQAEASRAAAELAQQATEAAQADVQQLHTDTVQAAQEAEDSRDSAAGYASAAEQSRKAAKESEDNVNAQITGFDEHVSESVTQAAQDIESARQTAVSAVTAQQEKSVQTVAEEGKKYIDATKKDAEAVAKDRTAVEEAAQTVAQQAQEVAQNTQTVATNTESAAKSAQIAQSAAENAAKSAESVQDAVERIGENEKNITSLQEDLKETDEILDSKITKFYASSQGEKRLVDSDNGKIMDMVLYGRSEQKKYEGYQLIPVNQIVDGSAYTPVQLPYTKFGLTANILDDGGIHIKGTNTSDNVASFFFTQSNTIKIEKGVYTVSCKNSNSKIYFVIGGSNSVLPYTTVGSNNSPSIQLTAETDGYQGHSLIQIDGGATVDEVLYPMFEKGSEAHDFEPYVGGIPSPNPDYPQEIKSVVKPSVVINNAGYLAKNEDEHKVEKLKLKKGKTYCLYSKLIGDFWNAYVINDANFIEKNNIKTSGALYGIGTNTYGLKDTADNNAVISDNARLMQNWRNGCVFTVDADGLYLYFAINMARNAVGYVFYDDIGIEEPYHEQTVTLPYTLNAIPVSSGGNVTIDGQQYIADYVDVERGKLVQMIGVADQDSFRVIISEQNAICFTNSNANATNVGRVAMATIAKEYMETWSPMSDTYCFTQTANQRLVVTLSKTVTTVEEGEVIRKRGFKFYYRLATPTETDLTSEEVQAFKALATYYSITNISATSDELDGYTVFNYPISMENGWNYVKQQLNDSRDYIYDMDARTEDIDTQSAEAYVNSEYAVALTELEV